MLKKIALTFVFSLCIIVGFSLIYIQQKKINAKERIKLLQASYSDIIGQLSIKATEFNCNNSIAMFIDFSIPSMLPRFFLVDLKNNMIISNGLVAHGQADNYTKNLDNVVFSNQPGSYCSSKGYYKTGQKYKGKWGIAYRLHGLEPSNDNALSRAVVLHAHSCVPKAETNYFICLSQGCPTLNIDYFESIQPFLDKENSPTLLYIYKNEIENK